MTENADDSPRRARRRPTAEKTEAAPVRSHAYRQMVNPFTPLKIFSDDHIQAIHEAALGLLENTGWKVLSDRALDKYAEHRADVDRSTQMVRIDRGLVAKALATVPHGFDIQALAPERVVHMSSNHVAMAPTSGPPNIMDIERGRRAGNFEDFCNILKLCQTYDVIHVLGGACEPQDIPNNFRHLEVTRAQLLLTDKVPFMFSRGAEQIHDNFELIRLAHGITPEQFKEKVYVYSIINTNSPLQLDTPMAEGIMDFALHGQPTVITPFTLAGAMAPVTIAGALTLAHAEALAGITLGQMTNPGAPMMYGSFTSNVDMKSGSPAFGTPEYTKAAFGAGQLARFLKMPWRSSNATASNTPDAQAAYESQMSLWGALLGGCNFILHAAGWVESGLSTSYEKFILDIEMLQMFAETFQPVTATADDIGMSAVAEVGPGGHFFGCAHTMERYRSAFYPPLVSDWRNFGQWTEDGSKTATQRANTIWKDAVRDYVPPTRDVAIVDALNDYVERRKAEGGAHPLT